MGCAVSGELRVNIPELRVGSLGFMDAAESLPEAPTSFPALGTDPLAQALTTRTNEVEAPLSDSLPTTRDSAKTTATNIGTAADKYEQTDQKASLTSMTGWRSSIRSMAPRARVAGPRMRWVSSVS